MLYTITCNPCPSTVFILTWNITIFTIIKCVYACYMIPNAYKSARSFNNSYQSAN